MTAQDALRYVADHANEYIRVAKLTGAGPYPTDNRCARCHQVSARPLIPFSTGWCCGSCVYGQDGNLAAVVTQPAGARCCETGKPLLLRCKLCPQSPTYWRAAS